MDFSGTTRADVTFEAWIVGRNARTLISNPTALFDTPHCAPHSNTLTLGVPMITMSIIGIPAYIATGDPVFTYNFAMWTLTLLSALVMYLLVLEWTGVPAAGIVAALLFAFHPTRLFYIHHPSVWDNVWTVAAMLFARRWFAAGRWVDAIGLAASSSLQVAASFYPLLAAALFAPAYIAWLVWQYGVRRIRVVQAAFVAVVLLATSAFVFSPYLDTKAATELLERAHHYFARWTEYGPGNRLFPGWVMIALTIVALTPRRAHKALVIDGDPRWWLVLAAFIVALVATGPSTNWLFYEHDIETNIVVPDFYAILSSAVPGLSSVRMVFRLGSAVLLAMAVLSGVGVAVLAKEGGRYSALFTSVAVLAAVVNATQPRLLGSHFPDEQDLIHVRADAGTRSLFEELERSGNRGAILEIPVETGPALVTQAPKRIFQTFYHRRRTSSCFGSYIPEQTRDLANWAEQLPEPSALRSIADHGFTTVVWHHAEERPRLKHLRYITAPDEIGPRLRTIASTSGLTAYEIDLGSR